MRYFELYVSPEKNKDNPLCQICMDNYFPASRLLWSNKRFLLSCRSAIVFDSSVGLSKGKFRHNRQGSRIIQENSRKTGSRHKFFIDEVRQHYQNLNRDVYRPLSNLTINPRGSTFFGRYRCATSIPDNLLSETARNHISVDSHSLLDEIEGFLEDVQTQNRKVNAAEFTIQSIIKNKFIKRGVFPAAHWHDRGYQHGQDLFTLLFIFAGEDFLNSNRNIDVFVRNYTTPQNVEYNTIDDYQKLGNFVLGKGTPEERDSMRIAYEQLIHDKLIFSAILGIHNGLSVMQ